MLRHFTAFILLIAFAAQSFQKAFVVLDYYTNTATFAQNCENKARPMLHCNGKCQLAKKLKAAEKKEQEERQRKGVDKNELLSSKSFFATVNVHVLADRAIYPHTSNIDKVFSYSGSIFQPPDGISS